MTPRESTTQHPANRPNRYNTVNVVPNSEDIIPRPMTKRTNYQNVSWHGPRCSLADKWSKEINPTMIQPTQPARVPRPPVPPSTSSRSRSRTTPRLTPRLTPRTPSRIIPANRFQYDTESGVEKIGQKNKDGDGGITMMTCFSRLGRMSQKRYEKRSNLPFPIDDSVGGTLVHIGATFLPSMSRRMR